MILLFPSREFDDAVAGVCHGVASDEQELALNELLRSNPGARDEYILRVEIHSRLASEPELFGTSSRHVEPDRFSRDLAIDRTHPQFSSSAESSHPAMYWIVAMAACVALLAAGLWGVRLMRSPSRVASMSKAVAMLNRTADAHWNIQGLVPRLNAPLEPGTLKLDSGLAQVVFYSGARIAMEGPCEIKLISQNEVSCLRGRILAVIPPQAHGFKVSTSKGIVTDLGSSFGLDLTAGLNELHVFQGSLKLQLSSSKSEQIVWEGSALILDGSLVPRTGIASRSAFATLFDLQPRSVEAEAIRYDQWRIASQDMNSDPSLLLHLDLEETGPARWQLRNSANPRGPASAPTIIGCQWGVGRWPEKHSLEFQSVNDRVRLSVAGEFESVTLAAWVCVKGLDRQINSLFMSDGFDPGTIHWYIRRDGVLGFTVIDAKYDQHQILVTPPVITIDKLGAWLHLAVVLDGRGKRVAQYVNGTPVSDQALKMSPPFRISAAELGNWNPMGFPGNDPFLIRNFSGAMDEFFLFSRALSRDEIQSLYSQGKPQSDL